MIFFQKNPSLKKKLFSFRGGEGKGGLASVSEFVLQGIHIKKNCFSFLYLFYLFLFFSLCVWGGGEGGGGGLAE